MHWNWSPQVSPKKVIFKYKAFLSFCLDVNKRVIIINQVRVSILLGFHFLNSVQLWNLCTPTRETSYDPPASAQLCGSSCKYSSLTTMFVIQFHMAFSLDVFCCHFHYSRDSQSFSDHVPLQRIYLAYTPSAYFLYPNHSPNLTRILT